MIDLVYILGSASFSNNIELKYSLASVERFMHDVRNIYIIGDHPGFNGNFIHIPFPDCGKNKQDNIRLKIENACRHRDIGETFLFMNDDFIITKPTWASKIPYYYNTSLGKMWLAKRKVGSYKTALHNTLIALADKELPIRHYDIHTPILYNKEAFLWAMAQFNWNQMHGYVIKSLYCNATGVIPEFHADPKVNPAYQTAKEVEAEVKDWFMFSFDDTGFGEGMKKYLESHYPSVKNICVQ